MNTVQRLRRLVDFLDDQGKHDAPVRADVRRRTLLRAGVKPEKPGAPLKYGKHEIVTDERPRGDV